MTASTRPTNLPIHSLAATAIRAWVRVYTAGLESTARARRRGEIDSDCWEHLAFSSPGGGRSTAADISLAWRALRGAPHDLFWRFGMNRAPGLTNASVMERTAGLLLFVALAALVVGVVLGPGIDTREQYFRESFSEASRDLGGLQLQSIVMCAAGLSFLAMSLVLATALRPVGRGPALVALVALALTGLTLVGFAALSIAVRELAVAWGDSAFRDTSLLDPARRIENARQTLAFGSVIGPLAVAGMLGWTAITRRSLLPRWLGVSAVVLLALSLAVIALNVWAGVMLTLLVSLLYLAAIAIFLIVRGIAPAVPATS